MPMFHNSGDSLSQLVVDANDDSLIPDCVRDSAIEELRNRGFTKNEIINIRLGKPSEKKLLLMI